ncbi:dihydroxyacetone kinase phosphoryl donor subunit DhaM [Naasia lichenicola]|uniref:Phosphocarrier protein HPr n=1 Tax=Naasia lichenicola TaxID=2565933 RepID=A0A4S4FUX3_9MICO|nr:dihydroxyacetone kinase phosphoryl donor subunit DhaM [Naasia lichenicola]THG33426.1 HPr family phosphocarrier protein [Naasia lichenicola]
MAVGIVFVSHSPKIAEGLVDLASQMASSARLIAAGGTDEGGIGTSFDTVSSAIERADSGDGVVVLCDLGSAILTAETALDFLDDELKERVRIADAPLVEGGVAAAVAAEGGAELADVLAAAESARGSAREESAVVGAAPVASGSVPAEHPEPGGSLPDAPEDLVGDTVWLVNREGLHARPAAEFVKLAGRFDAVVTVNGVDAKSLLRIMALGLTEGDAVTLSATGPQASDAVAALGDLVRSGFGEL